MIEKIQMVLIVLLIPIGILFWYTTEKNITVRELFLPAVKVVQVGEVPVRVDIAQTDEERARGLSGKENVGSGNGLLFIFPNVGYHGIWMKDMKFPIDVIWIGEDLTVVGVTESIFPETYPKTFRPPVPVKYLIETEARYTEIFGIKTGDAVTLPQNLVD